MSTLITEMRNGAYRVECDCGWWTDLPSATGIRQAGDAHNRLHRVP